MAESTSGQIQESGISRWLPSSSWVKMNEWRFFLCKMAEAKMAEFKMAAIIKLSQNEWVKFFCANGGNQSWQVWVSLKGNTKIAESKMAEFKMAAIFKFSENEWVKFFCANGGNQSWQVWFNLRGNTKMAESNIAKFKMAKFKIPAIIKLGENEWTWVRLN